ncbi:MAG TPA: glycosyltransferase, partial [Bacteroidales bacterium]|nr:glycosyltransferase [Bacteroidales bacterium]
STGNMMKKAVLTVISDVSTDQRVLKQAELLRENGFDVTVIGRKIHGISDLPTSRTGQILLKISFDKGPLMYAVFNLRLFFSLLGRKADLYVANDLDTLLPSFLVSKLFRRPLVYDSHEYFTGQHGLAERRFSFYVWKRLEGFLLTRIRWMITVSKSIADLYEREYGVNPVVVRNASPSAANISPRNRIEAGAKDGDLLVVFQGSGINPGRGAEELIEAMALTEGVRLLVIGSGDVYDEVIRLAAEKGVAEKVKFMFRMPWEEMMAYTQSCDAGLSLDKDTCINQRYSLPNKVFDYISAGIPVIVSPLREVSALVTEFRCGIILSEVTPVEIAAKLMLLKNDASLLASLKKKSVAAATELTWEKEKIAEQDLFRRVIFET